VLQTTAFSQEEFVNPPAKFITRFGFTQLTGGIIIVKAAIDTTTTDSLQFVLDTGSGGISLDSSTVDKLGFKKFETERTIRGIAGMKKVAFTFGHYLKFPGLTTDTFSFHINDYDLLTSVYGLKIDGIIGFSFLRRYMVKINYDNQTLEIYHPGYIKYPKGGYIIKPHFTTLPINYATVEDDNEINGRYIFDTGAGLCFLLSSDFVNDSLLFSKKKKRYNTQAEGLGGKKSMQITVVKNIVLGPYKFRKVPVYVFDDDYNVTNYPQVLGLLGNDILRRFNVILNYPEQTIFLKPNKSYTDNFDYAYTGLGVYLVNNMVTVVDIVPHSPGEKAGFLPGDIILAIENNLITNIQTIKALLQNAGAKLRVTVLRDGMPYSLMLRIKNILR
jgi:hypothetical protein